MTALINRLRGEFEKSFGGSVEFLPHPSVAQNFCHEIVDAHKHPLCAGGKRVRPTILALVAGSINGDTSWDFALPAGIALELVHTYSLVHDDLPCMDNDDFRRGSPTVHKLFGDSKGVLVGDGLLTRAFEVLSVVPSVASESDKSHTAIWASQSILALSRAAGFEGMIWGQWLDVSKLSDAQKNSEDLWKRIACKKTGCLLGAAFEMGVLAGLTSVSTLTETLYSENVDELKTIARECGEHVGLAFQIVDDILDVTASSEQMGKTTGKDIRQEKLTAVHLLGIEKAQELAATETQKARECLDAMCCGLRSVMGRELNFEYFSALQELFQSLLMRHH